jgi:hypothetical protein
MLNGIVAGLGDARQSKEATLAATRLWNDLRLAHGCKDRAEKPVLNDRRLRDTESDSGNIRRPISNSFGVGQRVFRT